jgi:hypothetical protein|eukprot:SAG25_NODE_200_length_12050_cov_3.693247_3_plen_184_part_00
MIARRGRHSPDMAYLPSAPPCTRCHLSLSHPVRLHSTPPVHHTHGTRRTAAFAHLSVELLCCVAGDGLLYGIMITHGARQQLHQPAVVDLRICGSKYRRVRTWHGTIPSLGGPEHLPGWLAGWLALGAFGLCHTPEAAGGGPASPTLEPWCYATLRVRGEAALVGRRASRLSAQSSEPALRSF